MKEWKIDMIMRWARRIASQPQGRPDCACAECCAPDAIGTVPGFRCDYHVAQAMAKGWDAKRTVAGATCPKCDGAGMRPPDDCPYGTINQGATHVDEWVIDCNICPHAQPCMAPCECEGGA
jgi:hypothetical protein